LTREIEKDEEEIKQRRNDLTQKSGCNYGSSLSARLGERSVPYLHALISGFASFASVPFAHEDALYIRKHKGELKSTLNGATVQQAPQPHDIVRYLLHPTLSPFTDTAASQIWDNIGMTENEQDPKNLVGAFILAAVFAWWTLPVLVISFLANLANISSFIPFLRSWQESSSGTFSAVSCAHPLAHERFFD
jgi:hypothetical protein